MQLQAQVPLDFVNLLSQMLEVNMKAAASSFCAFVRGPAKRMAPTAREHHFHLALRQPQHEFRQGLRVKRAAD
jgi:hypothetical protein